MTPLKKLFHALAARMRQVGFVLQRVWRRIILFLRLTHIKQIQGFPPPQQSHYITVCRNCATTFTGNYCSRCGQFRKTPRFTFMGGLLNTLSGLTNIGNGFGRTLLELLFRPGYMISDFIGGKRVVYFRPFQTLFVLAALYFVMAQLTNVEAVQSVHPKKIFVAQDTIDVSQSIEKSDAFSRQMENHPFMGRLWVVVIRWAQHNKAAAILFFIPIFAVATRMAFRRRKHNCRFNTTEHIFVQTYISSQLLLLSIFYLPFLAGKDNSTLFPLPEMVILLLYWWDYRQLFQGSWIRTLQRTLLMFFYSFILVLLLLIGGAAGIKAFSLI
jgi:hypothetical protein